MNKESKINKPEDLLGGIPIIGNKGTAENKELIKEAIDEFVKVLDPIMSRLGQAITEMQHRVAVVEETPKLVFPSKIDVSVTVKHETKKTSPVGNEEGQTEVKE